MKVENTILDGVKVIYPKLHRDERGYFLETFQSSRYQDLLQIDHTFVQDNHSHSIRHVLRGLHFQRDNPQGKLVRAISGSVLDIVVDIQPTSNTFGQWISTLLSSEKCNQLWIPPGFAHGFITLSQTADIEYKCTRAYDANDEGCLAWNDPQLNINWPVATPKLSTKDRQGLPLSKLNL
ncbi:dTDP-4-dehydrorhamnose 3,5-epimerase [Gammaproteobacteria bacterium 45_16_T64]|nr:dTDP-4-dehydrorhamnose 3,5-epimerase [Gammaproteobacteria bacterium 45_16_T64]